MKWYKEKSLVAKENRAGGRKSNAGVHTFEDIHKLMSFICSYAKDNALVPHTRVPGFKRDDVKVLPSSETKSKVYDAYKSASEKSDNF